MDTRPNLNAPLTTTDKLVAAAGWLVLLATWALAVASYAGLPASIPIHYDGEGLPTRYDHKSTIFLLPFLATVLGTCLVALGRRPQVLYYPVPFTAASAARLLRYVRLGMGLLFGFITLRTIQVAHGQAQGLGAWFALLALALLFGPLAYLLVRALGPKGGPGTGPRA